MRLVAIDPGFDVTGWATFEADQLPNTLQEAIRTLTECGEIDSTHLNLDGARLRHLGGQIMFRVEGAKAVVVEMPAYGGDYGNDRRRRHSVNKLYMAIGAVLSNVNPGRLLTVPAITTPKEIRHELLANAARMEGVELPEGPRGGKREDAMDAIWIGCQTLLERGSIFFPAH